MKPVRARTLVSLAVVVAGLGWLVLELWTVGDGTFLPLPWTAAVGGYLLAVVAVLVGLPVRRWVRGQRDRPLNPLAATRTVVFARAVSYGGAVLLGWYVAQGVALLPDLVGTRTTRFWVALVAAVGALALMVSGLVVQRWCRVPPEDDGPFPAEPPSGDLE
jgi:polyferredoxin